MLDLTSLAVHGGKQGFAMKQVILLKSQLVLQSEVGKQIVDFVSKCNFPNLESTEKESIFTSEGFVLGLAELFLTRTYLTLAYPPVMLFNENEKLDDSPKFLIAFGAIAALDIAHWATVKNQFQSIIINQNFLLDPNISYIFMCYALQNRMQMIR